MRPTITKAEKKAVGWLGEEAAELAVACARLTTHSPTDARWAEVHHQMRDVRKRWRELGKLIQWV